TAALLDARFEVVGPGRERGSPTEARRRGDASSSPRRSDAAPGDAPQDPRPSVSTPGGGLALALALISEREAPGGPRALLGRPSPCVGRDAELEELSEIFDRCVARPEARAVLVTAAAGAGKSRLRYELLRRLRSRGALSELLFCRGDPMRAGAPFGLIS